MEEIWKDIPDYEGLYQVSNIGRVKSFGNGKSTNPLNGVERIMKLQHKRYIRVKLSKNGNYKYWSVHRLVCLTFLPNPNNKPQINHIDGDRYNNNISNLEWVTAKENIRHSIDTGLQPIVRGAQHSSSKPIIQKDLNGNIINRWESIKMACKELGYNSFGIIKCCKKEKKYKTAYGYKWEYEGV
jgi:hypothetical protein